MDSTICNHYIVELVSLKLIMQLHLCFPHVC